MRLGLALLLFLPVQMAFAQAPSHKSELLSQLAKLGCQFYAGEADAPIEFDKLRQVRFRASFNGLNAKNIRGIRIDRRTNERGTFPKQLATAVAEHFPRIELLHLEKNQTAISAFAGELQNLTNVRYFHVRHDGDTTNSREIVAALPKLKNLEVLRLWDGWLTDGMAKSLTEHGGLPRMKQLALAPMMQRDDGIRGKEPTDSLSATTLSSIVAQMPELEYLDIVRCRLEGHFRWRKFSGLRNLKTIQFRWSSITDNQLDGISILDQLEHLDLNYAPITGEALIELSAISKLKYLGIYHTQVRSGISYLDVKQGDDFQLGCDPRMFTEPLSGEELALLLEFGVRGPYGNVKNNGEGQYSLAAMAKEFQAVNSIVGRRNSTVLSQRAEKELGRPEKSIQLGRALNQTDLKSLKQLNELSYISLDRATSQETKHLRELPDLEILRLENAHIDKLWVADLATNKKLTTVHIEQANIKSHAFEMAKSWKSLLYFEIEKAEFEDQAADRSKGIEGFPSVKSMSIGGTSLNDNDTIFFAKIRPLERITMHGSFTRAAIRRFTTSPSLTSLGLIGLKLVNKETDLLPLADSKIHYVRLNDSTNSKHYANIYSKTLVRRLGITMAGECSCGCLDIEPR